MKEYLLLSTADKTRLAEYLPLTLISALTSTLPRSDAATHVYVADSLMSNSLSTFFPIGMFSSGVRSTVPRRHLTKGIGDPMATHVRLTSPPGMTSVFSGGMENRGGKRRTTRKQRYQTIMKLSKRITLVV